MKRFLILMNLILLAPGIFAEVRVFVEGSNGVARVKYICTAGETVRAFALDISVDRGAISSVSNFFRGESRTNGQGYGIFPAALRDHITLGAGTNIDWNVPEYSPIAEPTNCPNDTLPGLYSSGVTLELGALWNPNEPAAVPGPTGTLCELALTEAAQVSITLNACRGGIVSALPEMTIIPVLSGAYVSAAPGITSISLENGVVTVRFVGGELETATAVDGAWTRTGITNGWHSEEPASCQMKFFRVRGL